MRVLFIANRYPNKKNRGDSPCIEQQRNALQCLGYDIDLLFINSKKNRLNYLNAIWQVIWKSQIKNEYDILHAHYGSYCAFVTRFQFACPIVVTFRGSDILHSSERLISLLVAKWADIKIVMNEQMKQILGCENTKIIPYGVDTDLFKPACQLDARKKLNLPIKEPLVLFPYNPSRSVKRYDLVEQAIKTVENDFPEVRVLSIFNKSPDVVVQYMNACDALILTSDYEGAPMTIREALACNLPIVSVDVGDVKKLIKNIDGCYICRQETNDIAQKLLTILRTKKRTNGRFTILNFNLEKTAQKISMLYQQLINRKNNQYL